LERTDLVSSNELKLIIDETNELIKIVAKSVITANGNIKL
jgi:hypothetical protein